MNQSDQNNGVKISVNLSDLALSHGTDKVPHCYIYERYFGSLRNEKINFFEIGIGGYDVPEAGGSSLRMWKEYFPNSDIYALDYYDKSPHSEDRLHIYQGSQDNPEILQKIYQDMGRIDIVLDDGSHRSEHVIASFEILFPLLASGGMYVVEDLATSYWPDHNGSDDLLDQKTSVSYFKRRVDGIQHRHFRHEYSPHYADEHIASIHFYENVVVITKK